MSEKLSVVIVDDSRAFVSQLQDMIADIEGVHVVGTANDGLMGLTLAQQLKPDLVLMDLIMPHMDGLTAMRLIQASRPETRVVVISSVGGSATRAEEAFRLGAEQVLAKPLQREQLEALFESELLRVPDSGGAV